MGVMLVHSGGCGAHTVKPERQRRFQSWSSREDSYTGGHIELAMRIALRFAKATPTASQIAAEFPMSRATAYRWVRRLKDAKGEA